MKYRFMRYPGGKAKAFTFSYDDALQEDVRFVETVNRYDLKGTFNLVGRFLDTGFGVGVDFIKEQVLDKGHEIANHGYDHIGMDSMRPIEQMQELLDSRLTLESYFGRIIRGYAFADKSVNRFRFPDTYRSIRTMLQAADLVYARIAGDDNNRFLLPEDWYNWVPTAHHTNPDVMAYLDEFTALDVSKLYIAARDPKLFFLWGHSFEFERQNNWELLESICEKIAHHDDIWYATNMEIYEYTMAYRTLHFSADSHRVYNPTQIDVWFDFDGTVYCVHAGETLVLE